MTGSWIQNIDEVQIMYLRMGKAGALTLWVSIRRLFNETCDLDSAKTFVCATAFFVVQTALQAVSRMIYALSRDRGNSTIAYYPIV